MFPEVADPDEESSDKPLFTRMAGFTRKVRLPTLPGGASEVTDMPSGNRPAGRLRALFPGTRPSAVPAVPQAPPAGPDAPPATGPVADRVAVEGFLDQDAAQRAARLARNTSRPVALDVTNITGFDSGGLAVLLKVESELGPDRCWVQGLEEATARLVGLPGRDAIRLDTPAHPPTQLTTLNRVAVVSLTGAPLTDGALAGSLRAAAALDVATVVVDLLGEPDLPPAALWELAEACAEIRRLGRRVLVVNASAGSAAAMSTAAMSPDVFVEAAEPPG